MKTLMKKLQNKTLELIGRVQTVVTSTDGELTTDHLGAWVTGVIIVGLLVLAVSAVFPGIFETMLNTLQSKLNALW